MEDAHPHDIIKEKRLRMLKAYLNKRNLLEHQKAKVLEIRQREATILPGSPIKRPKESKFNHSRGCTIAASGAIPPRINEKWWLKAPSRAGEKMNAIQKKLSSEQFFTGTQKFKQQSYGPNNEEDHGDITDASASERNRAIRLLSNVSVTSLTAHRASGDIHSEVNFRVHLRESCNM